MDADNSSKRGTLKCKKCSWTGAASQIEFDNVETCFGTDKIEMCPSCGSYELIKQTDQ
jgi:formate dehydrogenase maturation protein FdhE